MQHLTGRQFSFPSGSIRLGGVFENKLKAVTEGVIKKTDMAALADYFRYTKDMFATGEFWGKLLRAICLIAAYTDDAGLKEKARLAAYDMMALQKEDGNISTCPVHLQPKGSNGSDMWERKYALTGLLAYYELTGDNKALDSALALVKYTNGQIGKAPKMPITETGWAFCGIESSSILLPVMQVYSLTGDGDALELGRYIVESGCCKRENIFEAILHKSPYRIGDNNNPKESIAKAYEMMSCFEGLVEYALAVGDGEMLDRAALFWDKVYREEITLLGSGGADGPFNLGPGTGEQWNRTRFEQTNPDIDLMMETCVTVYWMKLCHRLFMETGDVKYMDQLERSLYNAIYGAICPDGEFFEYFPRFNGTRNRKVNYSFSINGFDLSCCTANGPTALGMVPLFAFCKTKDSVAVNMYEAGKIRCEGFEADIESEYPAFGKARITIIKCDAPKTLSLRVPNFAKSFHARVGNVLHRGVHGTYLTFDIKEGDVVDISFDISLCIQLAPHGINPLGKKYVAFTYGSLLLCHSPKGEFLPIGSLEMRGYEVERSEGGFVNVRVRLRDREIEMTDYMSGDKNWRGEEFLSWLPIK